MLSVCMGVCECDCVNIVRKRGEIFILLGLIFRENLYGVV